MPRTAVIASILACCFSLFIIGFLIAPKIFGEDKSNTSVNTDRQHENAEASESVHSQEIKQKEPTPTYIPTAAPIKDDTVATDSSSDIDTNEVINQNEVTDSAALPSVDNIVYIADVYESLTLRNAPSNQCRSTLSSAAFH